MQTITIEKYLQQADYIYKNYNVDYRLGADGVKYPASYGRYRYYCDCRGYAVVWILERAGITVKCPGTNYCIRKQMRTLNKIASVKDLEPGQVVFKVRPGETLPDIYRTGGKDYDPRVGNLDAYHIGVVRSVDPLVIYHCSVGGMHVNDTLGEWSYAGFLSFVTGHSVEEEDTSAPYNEKMTSVYYHKAEHVHNNPEGNMRVATTTFEQTNTPTEKKVLKKKNNKFIFDINVIDTKKISFAVPNKDIHEHGTINTTTKFKSYPVVMFKNIRVLDEGTEVEIVLSGIHNMFGEWTMVLHDGECGYVKSKYIDE